MNNRTRSLKRIGVLVRHTALVCVAVSVLGLAVFAHATLAPPITVKIIAFNDFHGNLQSPGSFRADAQSAAVPVGGADALAGYVEYLAAQNPNHVIVAAGDLVGASPLVSALFHDEGTIEVMNRLGLDFSSVGNHEFDKGVTELLRKQNGGCSTADKNTCEGANVGTSAPFSGAKFQYLSANVIDRKTGKTVFPADAVRTFNGVSIAFIGLTLEATPTMVVPTGVAGLRFESEAATINATVRELQKQGIRSFVVLIHQGGAQATQGLPDINACEGGLNGTPIQSIVGQLDDEVGLVISGHTHQAYICNLPNRAGRKVPVTSALSFGRLVTDIDVSLDPVSKTITSVTARNIIVDRTNPKITPDAQIKSIVNAYGELAAPIANRKVGAITADITNKLDATGESQLGDLIADSQLEATQKSAGAQIAFMNRGGIRTSLPYAAAGAHDGVVTYGELFTIQPFSNSLVTITLTGVQIKTLLEQQFKGCSLGFPAGKISDRADNQILQVSDDFNYSWNPAAATCHKVDEASVRLNGEAISPARRYRVTVNSFLADGGDQMYEFTKGADRVTGDQDIDAIVEYFQNHKTISPSPLGRIKIAPQSESH
jgi:5'-nucleotidase